MLKRILSLLLIAALCFCFPVLAENAEEETKESFRSLPGYTCFPLSADSNEEYPGHFCIDCPIEWNGGENSEVYGLPSVIAMDPENQNHLILAVETKNTAGKRVIEKNGGVFLDKVLDPEYEIELERYGIAL